MGYLYGAETQRADAPHGNSWSLDQCLPKAEMLAWLRRRARWASSAFPESPVKGRGTKGDHHQAEKPSHRRFGAVRISSHLLEAIVIEQTTQARFTPDLGRRRRSSRIFKAERNQIAQPLMGTLTVMVSLDHRQAARGTA